MVFLGIYSSKNHFTVSNTVTRMSFHCKTLHHCITLYVTNKTFERWFIINHGCDTNSGGNQWRLDLYSWFLSFQLKIIRSYIGNPYKISQVASYQVIMLKTTFCGIICVLKCLPSAWLLLSVLQWTQEDPSHGIPARVCGRGHTQPHPAGSQASSKQKLSGGSTSMHSKSCIAALQHNVTLYHNMHQIIVHFGLYHVKLSRHVLSCVCILYVMLLYVI